MEDDELTRARRALRGVDPEIDLRQVYAESWARAHDAEAHEDWATDERVEIVLHGTGPDGRLTRRSPRIPRRGPVLAWGAAAAAAAAAAVVVVVNAAGLPPQGTAPGGAPPTSSVSAPSGSPTTDTGSTPAPLPTAGLTSAAVVDRAAYAVATTTCGVETRSTLGDQSKVRFDEPGATDDKTPTPAPLDLQPLPVLQTVATDVVLQLVDLEGADYLLHDDVTQKQDAGTDVAQIRFTPPAGLVPGGEVTRIELLIDLTTWLPHSEQTWAVSDDGSEHLLLSEFDWTTCVDASPSATDAPP
ncbi:hypothetical protein [Promicromonospora soli]